MYFLTDGPPVELRTFLTDLLQTRDLAPGDRSLPFRAALAAGFAAESAWRLLRLPGTPPVRASAVLTIGRTVTLRDTRARTELGYLGATSRGWGMAETREHARPVAHPAARRRPEGAARVTLIHPPTLQVVKSLSFYGAVPPIGLAYVAAALRDAGHHVEVIDATGEALDRCTSFRSRTVSLYQYGLTTEEIVARIPTDTDLLGISHMHLHEWPCVRDIVEKARARLPHVPIVLGGENATGYWEQIFRESDAVDCCVLGEGEETIVEVVARLQAGRSLEGLPGVALRGHPPVAGRRVADVDRLPRPAWDLFPVEQYLAAADAFGVHRGRSMPMVATRGCPFRCTFCSSADMMVARNSGD
ncbi:MAG: hypothetical protein FJX76_13465 [Armatimonadetes bacterium]|nr:hypothetical protein [Armatimonadota bacterium]